MYIHYRNFMCTFLVISLCLLSCGDGGGNGSGNRAPELNSIGNKSVNEGELLQFTLSADDIDGDSLTYSTQNLPDGATIDGITGEFSWTPDCDDGGIYSNIKFLVTDDGSPQKSASESINITVHESCAVPSSGVFAVSDSTNHVCFEVSLDGSQITRILISIGFFLPSCNNFFKNELIAADPENLDILYGSFQYTDSIFDLTVEGTFTDTTTFDGTVDFQNTYDTSNNTSCQNNQSNVDETFDFSATQGTSCPTGFFNLSRTIEEDTM